MHSWALTSDRIGSQSDTADFPSTAEATVTTNLLGPLCLIAAFTELLTVRPEATLMTVSSGLGFVPLPLTLTHNATKAAIHSLTSGIRVPFADTGIPVIELVPPAVRTALRGQENLQNAVPLEDFLFEAMTLPGTQPDADEFLVEDVSFLRSPKRTAAATRYWACSAAPDNPCGAGRSHTGSPASRKHPDTDSRSLPTGTTQGAVTP